MRSELYDTLGSLLQYRIAGEHLSCLPYRNFSREMYVEILDVQNQKWKTRISTNFAPSP